MSKLITESVMNQVLSSVFITKITEYFDYEYFTKRQHLENAQQTFYFLFLYI